MGDVYQDVDPGIAQKLFDRKFAKPVKFEKEEKVKDIIVKEISDFNFKDSIFPENTFEIL